jgi:hypothetical protein
VTEYELQEKYWDLRYKHDAQISKSKRQLIEWWIGSPRNKSERLEAAINQINQLVKFYG